MDLKALYARNQSSSQLSVRSRRSSVGSTTSKSSRSRNRIAKLLRRAQATDSSPGNDLVQDKIRAPEPDIDLNLDADADETLITIGDDSERYVSITRPRTQQSIFRLSDMLEPNLQT